MSDYETEITRWDEWFRIVGMTKEWAAVKEQFPDNLKQQVRWAVILELNRISEVLSQAKQVKEDAGGSSGSDRPTVERG